MNMQPKFQQVSTRKSELVFALFKGIFWTPSTWTLSPGFQRTFWGSLDEEEFFVVEGSGVALTPGVGLPGVGPPGAWISAQALTH